MRERPASADLRVPPGEYYTRISRNSLGPEPSHGLQLKQNCYKAIQSDQGSQGGLRVPTVAVIKRETDEQTFTA